MGVVRRCSAGAVVAGLVLLGGPAWAEEPDPCAPGPDGSVPEMCQSGPVEGADPATPTADIEPEDPCAGSRPVEPGEGRVSEGDQGIVLGEPAPGTDPDAPEQEPEREPVSPDGAGRSGDTPPGAVGEDGIVCAFAVPVSAPADSGAGGAVPESAAAGQLPRTGPYDRLLAVTAVGGALVVIGAGAAAAGRRRGTQV